MRRRAREIAGDDSPDQDSDNEGEDGRRNARVAF